MTSTIKNRLLRLPSRPLPLRAYHKTLLQESGTSRYNTVLPRCQTNSYNASATLSNQYRLQTPNRRGCITQHFGCGESRAYSMMRDITKGLALPKFGETMTLIGSEPPAASMRKAIPQRHPCTPNNHRRTHEKAKTASDVKAQMLVPKCYGSTL